MTVAWSYDESVVVAETCEHNVHWSVRMLRVYYPLCLSIRLLLLKWLSNTGVVQPWYRGGEWNKRVTRSNRGQYLLYRSKEHHRGRFEPYWRQQTEYRHIRLLYVPHTTTSFLLVLRRCYEVLHQFTAVVPIVCQIGRIFLRRHNILLTMLDQYVQYCIVQYVYNKQYIVLCQTFTLCIFEILYLIVSQSDRQ